VGPRKQKVGLQEKGILGLKTKEEPRHRRDKKGAGALEEEIAAKQRLTKKSEKGEHEDFTHPPHQKGNGHGWCKKRQQDEGNSWRAGNVKRPITKSHGYQSNKRW